MSRSVWAGVVLLVVLTVGSPALQANVGSVSARTISADTPPGALSSAGSSMPENATASAHMAEDPRIVELYPNPVADGDPGEYVLVAFPSETNLTGWTISDDGRGRVELPNRTVSGRVAFSLRPERTRNHTEVSVQEASGRLQLANGGDTVQLRENGTVVDAVSYGRAAESERWLAEEDEGAWRPLGFTPREPVVTDPGGATVFTLPDAPDLAVEQLETADSRLLLAGYTLTAGRITEALLDAHRRGTTVSVLVDSSPVGGMSDRQASVLDRLSAAGIEVRVLGGAHARFSFHHAKYAVVDDRALVTTENWKPSGTGGKASRGWGVVIRDRATADELATLFEADSGWRDAIPWAEYRTEVETVAAQPASESYRAAFEPKRVTVESARVLVTPDNAEGELAGLLRSATDSIRIQQVAIGGRNHSLLRATLGAARRGVRVEIQLSSAWYVEEENRRLADRLRNLASTEGLDLTVELVEPRSRFEKVHTKGVVVDDRHVVVGSINWNDHSVRENREVAVVLTGPEIAAYYDRVLTADRRGGVWRLPAGIALVVALVWILTTGLVWRHLGWRRPALP